MFLGPSVTGTGDFLTPVSGIGNNLNPDPGFMTLVQGSRIQDGKIQIRDPGSCITIRISNTAWTFWQTFLPFFVTVLFWPAITYSSPNGWWFNITYDAKESAVKVWE